MVNSLHDEAYRNCILISTKQQTQDPKKNGKTCAKRKFKSHGRKIIIIYNAVQYAN